MSEPSRAKRQTTVTIVGLLLVVAIAVAIFFTESHRPATVKQFYDQPDRLIAEHGEGSLSVEQGILVLRVRGGDYERGEQHGALLRRQILSFQKLVVSPVKEIVQKRIGQARFDDMLTSLEVEIPESFRLEMQGVAAGAEITYEQVLLTNCLMEVMGGFGCSQLIVTEPRSEYLMHGRNLDLGGLGLAGDFSFLAVVEPSSEYPWLGVQLPGLIGVANAMNEEGLCISANALPWAGYQARSALCWPLLLRQVLEGESNALAASGSLTDAARTMPGIIGISDATGAALVLESEPDSVRVRRPANGFLAATNHSIGLPSPTMRDDDGRQAKLEAAASTGEMVTTELLRDAMQEVASRDVTMQSMIFLPRSRELLIYRFRDAYWPEGKHFTAEGCFPD